VGALRLVELLGDSGDAFHASLEPTRRRAALTRQAERAALVEDAGVTPLHTTRHERGAPLTRAAMLAEQGLRGEVVVHVEHDG
jgi:hypothetical protein